MARNATFNRLFGLLLLALALPGCGGSDNNSTSPPPPPPPTLAEIIATEAANPDNDSATNPAAAFTVLQGAGQPAVTVASAPKVNFTVFSDGEVVTGLTTDTSGMRVRFVIAKLVPGTNGDPDQFVDYVYRTRTGDGGTFTQATYDNAASTGQLVYNADGYYTYTFNADITDPNWENQATRDDNWRGVNGVTFEPDRTHRVAIQLEYNNAAGEPVRVNPVFDFTFDASGNSVAVTDPSQTRKMVDVTTCNECHNKLAIHGGGRVDTEYCVMCHNASSTDHESGNTVEFRTMVHKIHAGRFLHEEGEDYEIAGTDFSEVGFPANVRNCAKCHDGSKQDAAGNQLAAQGDNWKTVPSKQACLTCHHSDATSSWFDVHVTTLGLGPSAADVTNEACASCHGAGEQWSPDRVHWLPGAREHCDLPAQDRERHADLGAHGDNRR